MSEWINVKDELPERYKDVLVCCEMKDGSKKIYIDHMYEEGKYYNLTFKDCQSADVGVPIHWMPLPEPPVKKHECKWDDTVCKTHDDGEIMLETHNRHGRKLFIIVKRCPFCGERGK